MKSPSLLLFDLGGVLIENSTFKRLKKLIPSPKGDDIIKQLWLQSPSVRNFELGQCSPAEFAENFISEWDLALSPAAFLDEFYTWPSAYYPEAQATIRYLRQKYRVACLSNSNCLHWEKFDSFKDDFDIAISSHKLGAVKPDKEAFVKALEVCCAEPEEVCFFDDSGANIDTARNLGIRAHHVEGFEALFGVLTSDGLI